MAKKSLFLLVILVVLMMFCTTTSNGEVFEIGWGIWGGWPKHSWIETQEIHIGDTIGFIYGYDGVLQVTREDYESCNRKNPITTWSDKSGYAAFHVTEYGHFYFISEMAGHCEQEQRVKVYVENPYSPASPPERSSANAPSPSSEVTSTPNAPASSPSASGISSSYFLFNRFAH